MLNTSNHETEIKFRLSNAKEHASVISHLNAHFKDGVRTKVFEVNVLYDRDGELKEEDKVLRVRKEFSMPDGKNIQTILTFKGPATDTQGGIKSRAEFNMTVDALIEEVLHGLGYEESLRYEKFRITYPRFCPAKANSGDICEVVVDHLPNIGYFVEIEGPSESVIQHAVVELGLGSMKVEPKSYASIVRNLGKKK